MINKYSMQIETHLVFLTVMVTVILSYCWHFSLCMHDMVFDVATIFFWKVFVQLLVFLFFS